MLKFLKFGLILGLLLFSVEGKADDISSAEPDKVCVQASVLESSGGNFKILFRLQPAPGWHILAENPGDVGEPTVFRFYLPETWKIVTTRATTPKLFRYEDIIGQYGYDQRAYFLFEGHTTSDSDASAFEVSIHWMACRDECFPQEKILRFDLQNLPKKTIFSESEQNKAFASFPKEDGTTARVTRQGEDLIFEITPARQIKDMPLYFISDKPNLFSAVAPQYMTLLSDGRLQIRVESDAEGELSGDGILVGQNGACRVVERVSEKPSEASNGLFPWLCMAFLAGIILNLMPCVFPILSLKALSLSQSDSSQGHLKNGLMYILGVLSSFSVIAAVLYIIRQEGAAVGWGFQLQSPIFVAVMLGFFGLVFLSMCDLIRIRLPFAEKISNKAALNTFITGFLAVVIATPCTGPFMGAALGYALIQPPSVYFPVFWSLGLGYALPFALIEFFPKRARAFLPRPGRWMLGFKKILALPVLLTCLWFAWVLYAQIRPENKSVSAEIWQPYDAKKIENLVADGKPVLIDFTAKWCLTCLMNEHAVLNSASFKKLTEQRQIALFKADWTNRDEEISKGLEKYGRQSVPVYVYYPPQSFGTWLILPQILTYRALASILENPEPFAPELSASDQ